MGHHQGNCVVQIRVFPNAHDGPSDCLKPCRRVQITLEVRLQLGLPPGGIPHWPGRVLRATVPEAAIDENSDFLAWKQKVCSAARSAWNGSIHAIPVSKTMKCASQCHLRGGVTSSLSRHPARRDRISRQWREATDPRGCVCWHRAHHRPCRGWRAYSRAYNRPATVAPCKRTLRRRFRRIAPT